MKAAAALGVKCLTIKGDSQLLVNFSNKVYEPKDEHMEAYLAEVRRMEKQFWGLELQHVPRGTNQEADDIAKLLANVVISKKFLRTRKIMVMHSNERGE